MEARSGPERASEPRRFVTLEIAARGVAVVTVRREPVNAMNPELLDELDGVVSELHDRVDVRSVIFTSGLPGFFMVGLDLAVVDAAIGDDVGRRIAPEEEQALRTGVWRFQRTLDAIEALPQPTIAAMAGHAVGGGAELALACDLRLLAADPDLRIGFPEVRWGITPPAGGTQRLPRIVGFSNALMLLLEGRRLAPTEALAIGLVHELVDPAALSAHARRRAERLAGGGRLAQAMIKRCLYGPAGGSAGSVLENLAFTQCLASSEGQEGVRAFRSGRRPRFRHRDG